MCEPGAALARRPRRERRPGTKSQGVTAPPGWRDVLGPGGSQRKGRALSRVREVRAPGVAGGAEAEDVLICASGRESEELGVPWRRLLPEPFPVHRGNPRGHLVTLARNRVTSSMKGRAGNARGGCGLGGGCRGCGGGAVQAAGGRREGRERRPGVACQASPARRSPGRSREPESGRAGCVREGRAAGNSTESSSSRHRRSFSA